MQGQSISDQTVAKADLRMIDSNIFKKNCPLELFIISRSRGMIFQAL